LLASALPARSFTPDAPPVIVAVYVVEPVSTADGVNVTWLDAVLTVAVTSVLPGPRSWNVPVVTVEALIASLKFAMTTVPVLTPAAAFNGVTDVTVGAVTSGPPLVANTTSTQ
jgi:hypothetical protein